MRKRSLDFPVSQISQYVHEWLTVPMETHNTKRTGPDRDHTWTTMCDKGPTETRNRVWREEEEEDLTQMKVAAAQFFRVHGIPEHLETVLTQLFLEQPDDLHGYLASYFTTVSAPPRISRLKGREVYDARGHLSIQVELFCIITNEEKRVSSASVSSHFGPKDVDIKDRADHVVSSLHWIRSLDQILKGQSPCNQAEVDHILSSFFMARFLEDQEVQSTKKERSCSPSEPLPLPPTPPSAQTKDKKNNSKGARLHSGKLGSGPDKPIPAAEPPLRVLPGSSAIGSVSLAVAKAGAQVQGTDLYQYIRQTKNQQNQQENQQIYLPVVMVTLMSCGQTSPGKLNLLEEIILVPKPGQRVRQAEPVMLGDSGAPVLGYERAEQPLDLIHEACSNLGLKLGTEMHLVLNCSAPELMDQSKGKYEVSARLFLSPDELVDLYQTLLRKYPAVVALIDPLRREDAEQWEKLNHLIGGSCVLLSDITYKPQHPPPPGVKGHILKHINELSVSELINITTQNPGSVLMGTAYSQPCSEDSLPDVAVGLGLDYIKVGGVSGSERMSLYNRLISIEEQLDQQGTLVFKQTHRPPLFPEKTQDSAAES